MKIGAQLQMAIQNMDRQVDLARNAGSELVVNAKEAKEAIKQAKEADENLGNNVDVEA